MKIQGKPSLVGGTWSPESSENACLVLSDKLDTRGVPKATSMLEFVGWNPSTKRRGEMSLCSMPIEHSHGGPNSGLRGNLYMVRAVGSFVHHSDGLVKALVFDGHSTHQVIRRLLHGDRSSLGESELAEMPFFSELQYEPLPPSCIPHLPIKICLYRGQPFHAFPGACPLQ